MIDTHCHLDASRFDGDRAEVLGRAWAAGLSGVVVPAVGPGNWQPLLDGYRDEPRVRVALGIHPQLLPELAEAEDEPALEQLDALLAQGGAVAVGECGLDGPSVAGAPLERQVRVFKRHLALARKHQLPVLVHCLRVQPALREVLKEEQLPEAGVLLHSYSGGPELVKLYGKRGCHFSFAGPVTFEEARKPIEAARAVPLERLMVETDAPDQAPHPHRGGRSEPGYLPLIVGALAKAHGVEVEELAVRTAENARRFFRCSFRSGP